MEFHWKHFVDRVWYLAAMCLWNVCKRLRKAISLRLQTSEGSVFLLLPQVNPRKWDRTQEALVKVQNASNSRQILDALVPLSSSAERGLSVFFRKYVTAEEKGDFLRTIKRIAKYAAMLDSLLEKNPDPIVLKRAGLPDIVRVNRQLAASILAHSFFCLHPDNVRSNLQLPDANLIGIYASIDKPSAREKLRCWLHYFDRLADGDYEQLGGKIVSFERITVALDDLLTFERLSLIQRPLCPLSVGIYLDDAPSTMVKVDFANKYLGGGVLRQGCVQEEIMFTVCPELVVGMLFMEVMGDTEAIVMSGHERFCNYQGYGWSFKYDGDFVDQSAKDNVVVAIDAIPFSYGYRSADSQYEKPLMLREINKAYAGFKSFGRQAGGLPFPASITDKATDLINRRTATVYPKSIATGNWGCGAFGGDAQLKSLLQWLVASYVGCDSLLYCTFAQQDLDRLETLAAKLQASCSVGDLARLLCQYADSRQRSSQSVFDFIASSLELEDTSL